MADVSLNLERFATDFDLRRLIHVTLRSGQQQHKRKQCTDNNQIPIHNQ